MTNARRSAVEQVRKLCQTVSGIDTRGDYEAC